MNETTATRVQRTNRLRYLAPPKKKKRKKKVFDNQRSNVGLAEITTPGKEDITIKTLFCLEVWDSEVD